MFDTPELHCNIHKVLSGHSLANEVSKHVIMWKLNMTVFYLRSNTQASFFSMTIKKNKMVMCFPQLGAEARTMVQGKQHMTNSLHKMVMCLSHLPQQIFWSIMYIWKIKLLSSEQIIIIISLSLEIEGVLLIT